MLCQWQLLKKNWSEDEVHSYIKSLFAEKLGDIDFEILIPIGGNLVKSNLPKQTVLDGSTLCRLTHQKCIYVRPVSDILKETENVTGEFDYDDCGMLEKMWQASSSQNEGSAESSVNLTLNDTEAKDDLFESQTLIAIKIV